MEIAILLTCHNRKDKTLKCLSLLSKQILSANTSYDIILVDDGSTDGTAEAVAKAYPFINIIKGNGTLFWNRGMHLAWSEALKKDYDGVLWLNDDTNLNSSALSVVFSFAEKYENSIVVGTISSLDDSRVITYGGFHYYGKNKKQIMNPEKGEVYCDQFNGNLVFVPASVYKKIGIIDKYYRHSFGDFEYGRRANKNGIKCVITPVVGSCDRNPPMARWNRGNLKERLNKLYSPLGNSPIETFHYFKEESLVFASSIFLYLNIRAIFAPLFPARDDNRQM